MASGGHAMFEDENEGRTRPGFTGDRAGAFLPKNDKERVGGRDL